MTRHERRRGANPIRIIPIPRRHSGGPRSTRTNASTISLRRRAPIWSGSIFTISVFRRGRAREAWRPKAKNDVVRPIGKAFPPPKQAGSLAKRARSDAFSRPSHSSKQVDRIRGPVNLLHPSPKDVVVRQDLVERFARTIGSPMIRMAAPAQSSRSCMSHSFGNYASA
jgi:hypothetical protein